jgi:hypothetical protein
MSFANLHLIERAQLFTGSLIIGALVIGWAAAAILLGV